MSVEQPLVLVVDDNEMNRDMLSRRLERQGCQSLTAEDGLQALDMLPKHNFDLVLLDIMMPRMTGYEVLERVKNDPQTRHIPVIMISAVDDLESVVKCVERGADDYLFKPFNPILLKARISASLEKKRLRDQEQVLLRQAQSTGSSEANKAIVHRFFDSLSIGSPDDSLVSENYDLVDSSGTLVNLHQLRHVFTGLIFTTQDVIAEGDKVVSQLSVQPPGISILVISHIVQGRIASQQVFTNQPSWLQSRLT